MSRLVTLRALKRRSSSGDATTTLTQGGAIRRFNHKRIAQATTSLR
jgi:hypothetical protein